MKTAWAIAFGVACGLLGAGVLILVTRQPRGEAITLSPPPTSAPLVVHVAGAVHNPGLCSLPRGSRVADAIEAAGGLLPDADSRSINLAAVVSDGQRIAVPFVSQATPLTESIAPAGEPSPTQAPDWPININTATQAQLESLPAIGPSTALKIIAYREQNGPFQSIDGILDVPDIGPATFEKIRDLITIEDQLSP
ncbi:MAG: ComEA family DNA-binding protein [Chloroflexota bacterium]|nr:MAG: ComEA family DNA-binding protein [Chloroflexota bacterium]